MKEELCSDTVHLLSKLKLDGLILSRGEDAPDIYRKVSEKQPREYKVRLVVIRKKGQHPVHQI